MPGECEPGTEDSKDPLRCAQRDGTAGWRRKSASRQGSEGGRFARVLFVPAGVQTP